MGSEGSKFDFSKYNLTRDESEHLSELFDSYAGTYNHQLNYREFKHVYLRLHVSRHAHTSFSF